jgi:hypothetical protein
VSQDTHNGVFETLDAILPVPFDSPDVNRLLQNRVNVCCADNFLGRGDGVARHFRPHFRGNACLASIYANTDANLIQLDLVGSVILLPQLYCNQKRKH